MRTVAIVALKGGSGKTTIAVHLALAAHLRDIDTLMVDADPQHSTHDILSGRAGVGPDCITSTGSRLAAAQFAAVGLQKQLLIIDTPAGALEDVGEALVLADYAVLVVRPTLIDLAGLARTVGVVRRLGKPSTVVVSQAPIAREGVEPPLVKRALQALDYLGVSVAPIVLRYRTSYQTALERGRSVEETADGAAAFEIGTLWKYVAAEAGISAQPPGAG